jgi:D-lyxose ketol-isomerase
VPESEECIIGEVSTQNDDVFDNVFENQGVGRFPEIVEDEPKIVSLAGEVRRGNGKTSTLE